VDDLDNRVDDLDSRVDDLDSRLNDLDNRVDDLGNRVDDLDFDVKKPRIKWLSIWMIRLEVVRAKLVLVLARCAVLCCDGICVHSFALLK